MEPRRDDGDDQWRHDARDDRRVAAMEPRRDDGDDVVKRPVSGAQWVGRNGAPS